MPSLTERIQHAWNAFFNDETNRTYIRDTGPGFYSNPFRNRLSRGHERSIVSAVYNRIAIDCAAVEIRHVRVDENGRYLEDIDSKLNYCLSTEANIDQTGRAFIQDVVMSMLDDGVVAIVPVDTSVNPITNNSYDILSMRVGKIKEWYPQHIRVDLYNDRNGQHKELTLPKKSVAIVENPLYAVMNEPNSTLQRLIRKLNILDAIDEQSGSGKLDLIVQLPYTTRTEARRQQAEQRRKDIEVQLAGTKYGIAYIDAAEHVTQLNRSIDNNLMSQIEYLTSMLYSQLGITEDVMKGTADESIMLTYYNRTIEPILSAISNEMRRKFLTKTARSQLQSIEFYRDPFKLVPVNQIAEIADKFTRNEILTSNEIRSIIGMKPSTDPKADELRNKNISQGASDKAEEEAKLDEEQLTETGEAVADEYANAIPTNE